MIVRRADTVEIARLARAVAATVAAPIASRLLPEQRRVAIPPAHRLQRVLLGDVVDWVAFEMGVVKGEIIGRSRLTRYVRARDAVVWIGCHALHRTLTQVGSTLGGRDHTTIHVSRDRAERRIESDPAFRGLIDKLLVRLTEVAR